MSNNQFTSYAKSTLIPTHQFSFAAESDDLGTFRGLRVFSTAVAVNRRLFRLSDHIERIISAAKGIHVTITETHDQIKAIIQSVLAANPNEPLMIRLIISASHPMPDQSGYAGQLYIHVKEMPVIAKALKQKGARIASYPYQREFASIKLTNYVSALMAKQTLGSQFDFPLFVTPDNNPTILEGDTFNIFFVKGTTIETPVLDGRILSGITRRVICEQITESPIYNLTEKHIPLSAIDQYDEAFMTSSLKMIVPIQCIDNVQFKVGPESVTEWATDQFEAVLFHETGFRFESVY